MRRVWVTGVGVVASCGVGASDFWEGLHTANKVGVRRPVNDFDPAVSSLPKSQLRRMDRFSQFAVVAAEEALRDAHLQVEPSDRTAVSIGSGFGGAATFDAQAVIAADKGIEDVSPFMVPMAMSNAAAAAVSMLAKAGGPCENICTACAAGTHSIALAARWIQWGLADLAIAGGADAPLVDPIIGSFLGLGALSASGISQPFDANRDGFCLSEGAGVLVLEAADVAQARNAKPYAEIYGSASTADAYHLTAPMPDQAGAKRCLRLALADAHLRPDEVTHFNAHGTSTPLNDASEAAVIRDVFGDNRPAVTSIKGATGHSIGAAGAIEAVALALTYRHRSLPPTLGTANVDPALDIDVVCEARPWDPAPAVSTSFAFGGHNGALVFGPA